MAIGRPILYRSIFDNPWPAFRQFHDEINRIFGDTVSEVSAGYPPLNIWYNDSEAIVKAELPGVATEDLDLTVTGNTLTMKGSRQSTEIEGAKILRQERGYGDFGRNIQLPFDVEADSVKAHFSDGVLTLTLPRRKEEAPRKLKVLTEK